MQDILAFYNNMLVVGGYGNILSVKYFRVYFASGMARYITTGPEIVILTDKSSHK